MTECTFDVWERQPGGRETTGWSNVLRNVSLAEAEQYEETTTRKYHVEIHVPPALRPRYHPANVSRTTNQATKEES